MRIYSEIYFLTFSFLNVDISLIIKVTNLNFFMHIKDITGEGTVSQNFYIGLGSSRKSRKNIQKVTFPYIYFYIYVYFQN